MGNKWLRGTSRESRGVKGERVVSHGQDRTEDVRGVPWSQRERLGGNGVKGNIMDQMGSLGVVRGSQVIKREV